MFLGRLADEIAAYAGLTPPAWLLEARARERADELGLSTDDYVERASGGAELVVLAERLRVGETRFYRHRAQLDALSARVLPELAQAAARERRALRAWSAGCATGEEAWTLAMLLDEAAPGAWQLEASDLSEVALATAHAGRYPEARLADIPERLRARGVAGGAVREGLRARVAFRKHNLVDGGYPRGLDLILCRNVLIYFDEAVRRRVVDALTDSLAPGGVLLLGYSEYIRDHSQLELVDGIGYRKRTKTHSVSTKTESITPIFYDSAPIPRAIPDARPGPTLSEIFLTGDYHDASRLVEELRPALVGGVVDLDGASFLGDEAARVLVRARQASPSLTLRATRPAIVRWLAQKGLA